MMKKLKKIFNLEKENVPQHEIANIIGISKTVISDILNGKSWKHLQYLNPRLNYIVA